MTTFSYNTESNNNVRIWGAFYALIVLASMLIVWQYNLSEQQYSLLVCSNFIFVLWRAWCIKKQTPYFLFLVTYSFLFIGGHFWGCLFSPDLSLRVGSFMDPTPSTDREWNKTIIYILLFIFSSLLGYQYYNSKYPDRIEGNSVYLQSKEGKYVKFNSFLTFAFYIVAFMVLYGDYQSLKMVLNGGYSIIYLSQAATYSSNSFISVIFCFFFAMAMVYGNNKNRRYFLLLMLADGIIKILAGSRGSFGSFLMFTLWLLSAKYSINLKKITIGAIAALVVILAVSQQSKRAQDNDISYSNIDDVVGLFVYAQGESLATFEKSREYEYPVLPYIQTFIPGSSYLYAKLINPSVKNYESSFSLYLSRRMNQKSFDDGNGGGWTVMSDIYLFGGRTWLGYIILSYLFGYILALFENKSKYNQTFQVILFAIFLKLMILPRAGLNYICPLIVYVLIFNYICERYFKLRQG